MKLPDLIWSSAFVLCVVVAASAQGELARATAAISLAHQTASSERAGDSDHGREVAARFAPVFYQALGDKPRNDYITNFAQRDL